MQTKDTHVGDGLYTGVLQRQVDTRSNEVKEVIAYVNDGEMGNAGTLLLNHST